MALRRVRSILWVGAALSAHAQGPANLPPAVAPRAESLPALVLLLPGALTPFARAAEAVRQGFFAAHAFAGAPMALQVVEIDESPTQVMAALSSAQARGARLVVGPLSRTAVDAVARSAVLPLPVLALNTPAVQQAWPASLLALGLSVEDEARWTVQYLAQQTAFGGTFAPAGDDAVVIGSGPLAERAGRAFVSALVENGSRPSTFKFALADKESMNVGRTLGARPWNAVFLALSAAEAAALRPWFAPEQRLLATSQAHLIDTASVTIMQDLEGVYCVDMPWLIEPDHAWRFIPARRRRTRPSWSGSMRSASMPIGSLPNG
jgi:hypothetical protein